MAYNAAVYFTGLAAQSEADGFIERAAHLRGMAKDAKAKERAAKAAQRAMQKSARRTPPLMGFAAAGTGFVIKPY